MRDVERRYLSDPLFHARVNAAARVLEDEEGFDPGMATALAMATLDAADQAVLWTATMVECAREAGARWFAAHPDGASTDDEWRDHYRAVLSALMPPSPEGGGLRQGA